MAIGLGHDSADGVGAVAELDCVAHGESVVLGKDAVDGDFVVFLGLGTFAVGRDIDFGTVHVSA